MGRRGKLLICAIEWGPLENGVEGCKKCQAISLGCSKPVEQLLAGHRGSAKSHEFRN